MEQKEQEATRYTIVDPIEQLPRKTLIQLARKNLVDQKDFIYWQISNDQAYIEEQTRFLPTLTTTREQVEKHIAERKTRVYNLQVLLQMSDLTLELLERDLHQPTENATVNVLTSYTTDEWTALNQRIKTARNRRNSSA